MLLPVYSGLKLEGIYRISPSLGEILKLKDELNRGDLEPCPLTFDLSSVFV